MSVKFKGSTQWFNFLCSHSLNDGCLQSENDHKINIDQYNQYTPKTAFSTELSRADNKPLIVSKVHCIQNDFQIVLNLYFYIQQTVQLANMASSLS